jgi:hypothetical protein
MYDVRSTMYVSSLLKKAISISVEMAFLFFFKF